MLSLFGLVGNLERSRCGSVVSRRVSGQADRLAKKVPIEVADPDVTGLARSQGLVEQADLIRKPRNASVMTWTADGDKGWL
ncbi:hypothetical protein [Bradyrhizobium sp. LTSP885]|uniref:hypothetical protein n=1 Tax=Bradyrhizobium sp. LTSP885 TaxID=1619232 RepID=UPI0012E04E89|nr:hypothetical protein [Bradyrhizobium sp. LTSP885]